MTVGQIIDKTPLPKPETELILTEVLKVDKAFIFAYPEKELSLEQEKKVQKFIKRRLSNEPLAYIFGHKEFFSLDFSVNKNVLIPRPETEELVEIVIKNTQHNSKVTVVDVGTGSGCISVSIAKNLPLAKVYAIDASKEALEVARENALKHHVQTQIEFLEGNLLKPLPPIEKIDFILANLPYIPTQNYLKLERQIKDFEPKLALDSGESPMKLYDALFSMATTYLKKGTWLFYELDGEIMEYKNFSR